MDVIEIFDKIKNRLEAKYDYIKNRFPMVADSSAIINDFNRKFEVPHGIKKDKIEQFEKFCEQIFETQANSRYHGLTCGVDGGHLALVPRITSGGVCVLVCPTCGYVQDTLWFFDQKI